ncbi:MAG: hypothetical protein IT365_21170 [Candidatus Hydrogenedentes bacterium]|nr:hypothetical protein [Candidatus Hydrogenedentota bacterium]
MRKVLPGLLLLILSTCLVCAQTQEKSAPASSWRESYFAGEPLRIGNGAQFLFDDYVVEDKYGLTRVLGPVEKFSGNPLSIGANMPWEVESSSFGGANLRHVVFDPVEQVFKGWYVIYRVESDPGGAGNKYNYCTLYAESSDGITWEKPALDLFLHNGEKSNIVLREDHETALLEEVMLDPQPEDPSRRFVGLVKTVPPGENSRCIVRMHSPDGKRWTLDTDPVLFRGASDGAYSLVRDAERQRWLLYRRPPTRALENAKDPFYSERNNKRRLSVSMSSDLKTWTYPRGIVLLDEVDDARLEQMGNRMDIDWARAIKSGGVFFGFLSLMDNLKIAVPVHDHLMWSRDGLDWERLPERPLFIENGPPGDWDSNSIHVGSLVPHDDRIHIYYSGSNTTQSFYGREGETNIPQFTGTGLAFVGRDRFIGLQAGPEGGYLLTRQLILEGNRIEVNCRTRLQAPPPESSSELEAEILQPAEEHFNALAYPGFSFEECDAITVEDSYSQALTWNGSPDLSQLQGKPVYIRFRIRNATLYTFTVLRD